MADSCDPLVARLATLPSRTDDRLVEDVKAYLTRLFAKRLPDAEAVAKVVAVKLLQTIVKHLVADCRADVVDSYVTIGQYTLMMLEHHRLRGKAWDVEKLYANFISKLVEVKRFQTVYNCLLRQRDLLCMSKSVSLVEPLDTEGADSGSGCGTSFRFTMISAPAEPECTQLVIHCQMSALQCLLDVYQVGAAQVGRCLRPLSSRKQGIRCHQGRHVRTSSLPYHQPCHSTFSLAESSFGFWRNARMDHVCHR
jgi:hypothetical protein